MMLAVSSVLMLGGMFPMTTVLRWSLMLTWACRLGPAARRQRREVPGDGAAGQEVRQSDDGGQLRVCHARPLDGLAGRIDDRVRAKRRAEPLTVGAPVDDGDGQRGHLAALGGEGGPASPRDPRLGVPEVRGRVVPSAAEITLALNQVDWHGPGPG